MTARIVGVLVGVIGGAAVGLGASAQVVVSQPAVSGGGISRWSQLWQDPGPNGNDLDSDSVCWADFTLAAGASINHIEWWGVGACELGFRIEVWEQDSRTIAYQPMGAFYYGGDHTVQPAARFTTTAYTVSPGPGAINHYTLDLAAPITLAANDAGNPRWFISVIGLTQQAFYTWDWSQGVAGAGGSNRTYQWVRGLHTFRSLGEGRAMVLAAATAPSCPADFNGSGTVTVQDMFDFLSAYFVGGAEADVNASGSVTVQDIFDYLAMYFAGC